MSADLTAPHFTDEDAARKFLENVRWPHGPICPHCGVVNHAYALKRGKYRCAEKECRKDFSVTVGTVFERSHIPLHKWLLASHLLASSKKGMSAHQLHRMLGVTYKTAWFLAHRIREAMVEDVAAPLGGSGGPVEADETYIGTKKGAKKRRGYQHKHAVFALVERGGAARAFKVEKATAKNIYPIMRDNVSRRARLMTDEHGLYEAAGANFASHDSVNHSKDEYVRGDAHTNTVEGFFSIFKRGMKGIYQHCGEKHLPRYLTEFSFRYTHRKVTDVERALIALRGIEGKRLTYGGTC